MSDVRFYTNIERKGNVIYYTGYDGKVPVKYKVDYEPELFVYTNEPSQYKSFQTNYNLKRVQFPSISKMKEYIESYSDVGNYTLYGCSDIIRQYTANEFPKDIVWDYALTEIYFYDIETKTENGFPDVYDPQEEIQMLTMMNHHRKIITVWSTIPVSDDNEVYKIPDVKLDIRVFNCEQKMLKDIVLFFSMNRIDILSGWNSEAFDMIYMVNRIKDILGENIYKHLSPWKIINTRQFVDVTGDKKYTYDLSGISHLDYLILYKKFNPGSKESFKLDYIAELELGENKVENPAESFKEFYTKFPEEFVYYNVIDVMLLHKLESKMLLIRLAMQLAYMAKCQFQDVVSAMRLWESIIYNYFLDINIIDTIEKPHNEKENIVGAYVHEPKPGKHGWCCSVDATSLYPSIMMQNNISPETVVSYDPTVNMELLEQDKHHDKIIDGTILSANGLYTRKDDVGFIPLLVERMFTLRKKTKNLMLEKKKEQQAIKEQLAAVGVVV